jgi:hypothetical protein
MALHLNFHDRFCRTSEVLTPRFRHHPVEAPKFPRIAVTCQHASLNAVPGFCQLKIELIIFFPKWNVCVSK